MSVVPGIQHSYPVCVSDESENEVTVHYSSDIDAA